MKNSLADAVDPNADHNGMGSGTYTSLDRLLPLLACPACRGSVEGDPGKSTVTCLNCREDYPVVGGIPIMLTEGSKRLLEAGLEPNPASSRSPNFLGSVFWRIVRIASPGGTCYDPDQTTRIQAFIRELCEGAAILDLGSGGRWWGPTVIGMDIDRLPHVSVVGDGHRLPFLDRVLDGVICTGVLEHVNDAEAVTREIWRVLRPGGMLYVAVPFIQGYHPASGTHQDYRRLTHIGLQRLLSDFEQVGFGVSGGPSSSLAWILREYLALLFVGSGRLYHAAYLLSGWLTIWLKYLDRVLMHRKSAYRIACGFYFLGRKPSVQPSEDV